MLNSQPQLDLVFQALSDPTRRAIVERLGRGPASVSQLAQPFAISLPAVLQHVAVLEASGLVRKAANRSPIMRYQSSVLGDRPRARPDTRKSARPSARVNVEPDAESGDRPA